MVQSFSKKLMRKRAGIEETLSHFFPPQPTSFPHCARLFFSLSSFYLRPHYIAFESPAQAMRLGAPFTRNHLKRTEIEMPSRSTFL